jgi:hypothetical protein
LLRAALVVSNVPIFTQLGDTTGDTKIPFLKAIAEDLAATSGALFQSASPAQLPMIGGVLSAMITAIWQSLSSGFTKRSAASLLRRLVEIYERTFL